MNGQAIVDILMIVVSAATPLLIAAVGEIVAERAGVLNLGLEGHDDRRRGDRLRHRLHDQFDSGRRRRRGASAAWRSPAVFAFLVIGLAANQVAAGLAITIFGRGLANLIGSGFVGLKRARAGELRIPGLTDLPMVGKLLFGQDFFVYGAILLTAGVAYWLTRTRAGLTLRAVGENHTSAHGLGLPVRAIRLGAILFGGACAGVARQLSVARLHPVLVAGHDRRPRLDRAGAGRLLVLAAVARARRRAAVRRRGGAGARLPGARRADPRPGAQRRALRRHHSRARVLLSARDARGAIAPQSLGVAFIPDR